MKMINQALLHEVHVLSSFQLRVNIRIAKCIVQDFIRQWPSTGFACPGTEYEDRNATLLVHGGKGYQKWHTGGILRMSR